MTTHNKNACYLAVLAALSQSVWAQTDEQTTTPEYGFEKIEVTAQRKSESIQDAALPIDAITQNELSRDGVSNVMGLSKVSPSLSVVSGGGSNAVYFVRGVGNFAVNAYTDPALAFNVDGIYIGRPSATTASFLDLERVEVLKGPQGTLYGRNATAGAINIIPQKPVLDEYSASLSLGVGNYGTLETSAAVNFPIADNWAARVAGATLSNDGYNDDGTASTDDAALRAQVFGEVSDDLTVRVSVDYSTTQGTGSAPTYLGTYGFPFAGVSDNPNNIPGYNFNPAPENVSAPFTGPYTDAARDYFASLSTTPGFTSTTPQRPSYIDNEYIGVTGEINLTTDLGDLVILPAYREADIDLVFVSPGFQAAENNEHHEQFSLESRFSFTAGNTDWIFGAYYFDETVSGALSFNQYSLQSTQTIEASESTSTALFARATYHLNDDLRLVGGIRWSDDEKSMDGVANVFLNVCIREMEVYPGGPVIPNCDGAPVIPAGLTIEETLAQIDPADLPLGAPGIGTGPVPFGQLPLFPGAPDNLRANLLFINPTTVQRTRNESEITYRIAAEYDAAKDSLLYASVETGYRSGGFTLSTGKEEFEPEFLNAYTLGSKNLFLNGVLKLNAELFYWDYEDQQASHLGLDANGNSALVTENIGESSIKGAELDIWYAASADLTVRGTMQYLNNKIEQYSYQQLTPDPDVRVVTGCAQELVETTENGGIWDVDCSGKEGRNSPKLSGNLGVDYHFELGDWIGTYSLDARYRGDRWIGFDYLPVQRAEAVTTVDTALQFETMDGDWQVMAYARNVTNEGIQSITQTIGLVDNVISTVYEPPRTVGIRVSYNYF